MTLTSGPQALSLCGRKTSAAFICFLVLAVPAAAQGPDIVAWSEHAGVLPNVTAANQHSAQIVNPPISPLTSVHPAPSPHPTFDTSGGGSSLKWPTIALVAGQGLDWVSTEHGWRMGLEERNPIVGNGPDRSYRAAALKGGTIAATALAMKWLGSRGPLGRKAAHVIGYTTGAVGAFYGARNLKRAQ